VPWALKFWEYGTNNQKGFRHMASKKKKSSGRPGGSSATQASSSYRPVTEVVGSNTAAERSSSGAFFGTAYFEWFVIAFASVVSYWILTARLVGVNVSVLIDEYLYVLDAHYKPLSEADYPNHLFQLVFSVTKECGSEFYACARSLNAVFVIAGAIFIYLLAKYISGKKWLGAIAATAAVLGSYGTYTAYFMPEAIFNFPMIVFYWALIRFGKTDNLFAWAGFGTILGIASLAKPHALFVVPALVIFIFLWTRATKDRYLIPAILRVSIFTAAIVSAKLLFGYLIAGQRGFSLFGRYGTIESATNNATSTFVSNSGLDVVGTSWGQTLMVTVILGVALPVAILGFLNLFKRDSLAATSNRVGALVGISLLNMMAVSAVFEAWQNLFTWMHTRYYSYLIPLAVVALIEAYSRANTDSKPILKRIVVGIFVVIASIALVTAAIPYGANWIDAPDFRFHIDNLVLSSILIAMSIALAIWWLWDNKKPMLLALIVAVVASTFSGTHISNFLVASFGRDTVHDHLGRVLRDFLPQEELDRTLLLGDNNTTMERALFSARTGSATAVLVPGTGFDINELDSSVLWVVRVGEPIVTGLGPATISGIGYSIHSLRDGLTSVPRSDSKLGFSNGCEIPSDIEWSCGSSTVVNYESGEKGGLALDLLVEVSETAAQGDIEFVLGQTVLTGQLPKGTSALALEFPLEKRGGELIIRAAGGSPASSQISEKFVRVISINTR
jgi:phosphoglycerol transferase